MDSLSNFFRQLLQNCKIALQQIKYQASNIKYHLQNNKPLALCCVAMLGLLFFSSARGFMQKNSAKNERKPIAIEVHTKVLAPEPMYKTVTLFGQTSAAAKINVVNKYAGMITEVHKDLGDKVSVGDVLAQQDLKDINIQIDRAEADFKSYDAYTERYDAIFQSNFAKYQSDYNLKKTNFDRYTELFKKGAVSKLALDEAEQQIVADRLIDMKEHCLVVIKIVQRLLQSAFPVVLVLVPLHDLP